MQRLFSAFPDGRPGIGLFLLRAMVGLTAVVQGAHQLDTVGDPTLGSRLIDLLAIGSGASVLLGFLTPGTGAIVGLSFALCWLPAGGLFLDRIATLHMVADAVVIALLGPGAFSLDARLFGRREILLTHQSRLPKA